MRLLKPSIVLTVLTVLGISSPAVAQTDYSGTLQCGKPDKEYRIEVGDQPDHVFVLNQGKCIYISGGEIAGIKHKELVFTNISETIGNKDTWQGINVVTLANGDKLNFRIKGTTSLKDGAPESGECGFEVVSGTGKFANLKLKGRSKGRWTADGSSTWEYQGEYELPD